ncbi:MAG: tripartite tricarboxylate transporter TctB family protein [Rhodospirillaceae bacterium]|jgi:putative tricarboxylic transport membrane protein|nr:tripartite tricarboxylate transporter TctB family protein [Rhodospirillaceae bacterium]MBT4941000.1 tripartite tricarboxylate transporter TctB family protein [Rhodospirillaceae bacterium]MBT7268214.1 tripartite tricarboxylate transporter TctB family protein [Rhodospirillaceae bacterium]
MNNMRTRNLIAGIVMLFLCAGYAYLTANLPSRDIQNTTQPSFFPWVIVVCMAVLSLALLIQGLLQHFDRDIASRMAIPPKRLLIGLVLAVAYLVTLPSLGFIVANILLFAGLMFLYGEHRPLWIAVGSIVISVTVFFIFREIFQIRLTAGVLESLL